MNNQENNLPPVVTVESLKETHGADAERVYHQIADIGGFGDFTNGDYHGGHPPLALVGVKGDAATAIAKILATKPELPPNTANLNKIPAATPETKEGNQ